MKGPVHPSKVLGQQILYFLYLLHIQDEGAGPQLTSLSPDSPCNSCMPGPSEDEWNWRQVDVYGQETLTLMIFPRVKRRKECLTAFCMERYAEDLSSLTPQRVLSNIHPVLADCEHWVTALGSFVFFHTHIHTEVPVPKVLISWA